MRIETTGFDEVKLIYPDIYPDDRGSFAESYDRKAFSKLGIEVEFVQDSWSSSVKAGTVRGLHFQGSPRAQNKLVRVTRGRVFDVIVDVRRDSANFGKHICFELDSKTLTSVFVPVGFAHGFCSLTDGAEITYKMSDHFSPAHYQGLRWNDPELAIKWPVDASTAIISEKDALLPLLSEHTDLF